MTDTAAWIMTGGLALALAISLVALIVAVAAGRRPGPKGDTGPMGMTGPMGVMGEPGVCRCPDPDDADQGRGYPDDSLTRAGTYLPGPRTKEEVYGLPPVGRMDFRRREAEAIRYRAVVHWDDREVIGYGPHQATPRAAERDGQECVDRHAANWYTVEQWTAGYWIELED